jgi:hypothetical protein
VRHVAVTVGVVTALVALALPLAAVDLDVTAQDIDRALTIARGRDADRARFHAPYIKKINTPGLESAEIVTEYRRVVVIAEERTMRGDRHFAYSVSGARLALTPWKQRLSMIARLRFHPQNNYVNAPTIEVSLDGNAEAFIEVRIDPVLAAPSGQRGERLTVLGAVAEGVFDAVKVGQGTREFVVRVDRREIGRVSFNLDAID